MVLNTPSYGGGSDLWDEQRKAPLSSRLRHMRGEAQPIAMDDGLLEVVGVTDVVHRHGQTPTPRLAAPKLGPCASPGRA